MDNQDLRSKQIEIEKQFSKGNWQCADLFKAIIVMGTIGIMLAIPFIFLVRMSYNEYYSR